MVEIDKKLIFTVVIFVILFFLSVFIDNFIFNIIRILLGIIFLMFLPGYMINKFYFNEKNPTLILSFILSITIVPLILFYLSKLGVKINLLSTILIILFITVLSILIKGNYLGKIKNFSFK